MVQQSNQPSKHVPVCLPQVEGQVVFYVGRLHQQSFAPEPVTAVDHLAGAFEAFKRFVLGVGLDQLGDAAAKSRLEFLDGGADILDGVVKEPGQDGLPVIPPRCKERPTRML